MALGQQSNYFAPGHYQRNAYSTGYGMTGGPRNVLYQGGQGGKYTSVNNPFQSKPQSSGPAMPDFNKMFGGVPNIKTPTGTSNIDVNGILKDYLPSNVVQAQTNNEVAEAQKQFSPQQYLERHSAGPNNLASASSGQTMQMMPGLMAPGMQAAAMSKAVNPINAQLARYDLEGKAQSAATQQAMQLSRIGMEAQGNSLDNYQRQLALRAQMAQQLLG